MSTCGEFNFSLESIFPRELIFKAELRLYISEEVQFGNDHYLIVLERYRHGHEPEKIHTGYISAFSSGWQIFNVEATLTSWVKNLATHPHRIHGFRIRIFQNEQAYYDNRPYACKDAPVQFVSSRDDLEHEPLLVVYSFDPEAEKINYKYLLDSAQPEDESSQRRRKRSIPVKRNVDLPPQCSVHSLMIISAHLNSISQFRNQQIVSPERYDAGICGGVCEYSIPTSFAHASLVHLLISRNSFTQHNYQFVQCCSPTAYESKTFLTRGQDDVFKISVLQNMKITSCECIDVVSFTDR